MFTKVPEKVNAIKKRHEKRKKGFNTDDNGHVNTQLPYGIAASKDIDTEGLKPKEVWDLLEDKGISAQKAYEALSEGKTGSDISEAAQEKTEEKQNSSSEPKVSIKTKEFLKNNPNTHISGNEYVVETFTIDTYDLDGFDSGTKISTGKFKATKTGKHEWSVEQNEKTFTCGEYTLENMLDQEKTANIVFPEGKTVSLGTSLSPKVKKEVEQRVKQFDSATVYEDASSADKDLRKNAGKIWRNVSEEVMDDLWDYTDEGYDEVNHYLVGKDPGGSNTERKINNITDTISQSKLEKDTILYRGVRSHVFEAMFGIPRYTIDNVETDDFVGMTGRNKGFSSCGSSEGTGFTGMDVMMNILCPKGTQAIYCEPWSANGSGDGIGWDGLSGQYDFSAEDETLLQRGSSFQILRARRIKGKLNVDVVVVDQTPDDLEKLKKEYKYSS